VELVNYLVTTKRLTNLLFTMDGKEYVTEKKLEREIRDQIYLKGGRITRTDLQAILKIDYSHIERITNNMIQHDAQLTLVNGEIITT
jgi:hypothetical protein